MKEKGRSEEDDML